MQLLDARINITIIVSSILASVQVTDIVVPGLVSVKGKGGWYTPHLSNVNCWYTLEWASKLWLDKVQTVLPSLLVQSLVWDLSGFPALLLLIQWKQLTLYGNITHQNVYVCGYSCVCVMCLAGCFAVNTRTSLCVVVSQSVWSNHVLVFAKRLLQRGTLSWMFSAEGSACIHACSAVAFPWQIVTLYKHCVCVHTMSLLLIIIALWIGLIEVIDFTREFFHDFSGLLL